MKSSKQNYDEMPDIFKTDANWDSSYTMLTPEQQNLVDAIYELGHDPYFLTVKLDALRDSLSLLKEDLGQIDKEIYHLRKNIFEIYRGLK